MEPLALRSNDTAHDCLTVLARSLEEIPKLTLTGSHATLVRWLVCKASAVDGVV